MESGSLIYRFSELMRRRRDVKLLKLIDSINGGRRLSILDLGGTKKYWERIGVDYFRRREIKITVLNYRESEISDNLSDSDIFSFVVGDACNLAYENNSFDLVHSNSVIEHVQNWHNMKLFARETRRLAIKYYVQTPYYWFPIDPHFYKVPLFHWLPYPIRRSLLMNLPIAHAGRIPNVDMAQQVLEGAQLLDARQFKFLFPDSHTTYERVFGMPKSLIAIRY